MKIEIDDERFSLELIAETPEERLQLKLLYGTMFGNDRRIKLDSCTGCCDALGYDNLKMNFSLWLKIRN